MITALVTDKPISIQILMESVKTDQAGAVASFCGDVRNNDADKAVKLLTYEVHPTAQKVIQEITERISAQHDVINVSVAHRYGAIGIGETAFAVVFRQFIADRLSLPAKKSSPLSRMNFQFGSIKSLQMELQNG